MYALSCACLTDMDVKFLLKLKQIYKDCGVLFCIKSLSNCFYSCYNSQPIELPNTTNFVSRTVEHGLTPSCSSSHDLKAFSHASQMPEKNLYTLNALTTSHCDICAENVSFPTIDNFSQFFVQLPKHLKSSIVLNSKKSLNSYTKCNSRLDRLEMVLDSLGFSLMHLTSLKSRDSNSSLENAPVTEQQPKSLVFLVDDKSKTVRITIPYYLKKLLQVHITKAAKMLYR